MAARAKKVEFNTDSGGPVSGAPTGHPCPLCEGRTLWKKGIYGWFAGCENFQRTKCRGIARDVPVPVGNRADAKGEEAEESEGYVDPAEASADAEAEAKAEAKDKRDKADADAEADEAFSGAKSKEKSEAEMPNEDMSPEEAGANLWAVIKPHAMPDREEATVVEYADALATNTLATANSTLMGQVKRLEKLIAEANRPQTVTWTVNGLPFAKKENKRTHVALDECLRRVKAGIKNILLTGPAGCGKTTVAKDLAEAMDLEFGSQSMTSGTPEWHLIGRSVHDVQKGKTVYESATFVDRYEKGGVMLLDEMDASDANMLLIANTGLANGYLNVPTRHGKPQAARHANCVIVGAANTVGTGANRMYVGRNQLDASTLSRFACAIIEMDYDRQMEGELVGNDEICKAVWTVRDRASQHAMRRVVGTRELIAVAQLVNSGESISWALKALTGGWSADERTKVGVS